MIAESDFMCKDIKISCSLKYRVVEMQFSSNRELSNASPITLQPQNSCRQRSTFSHIGDRLVVIFRSPKNMGRVFGFTFLGLRSSQQSLGSIGVFLFKTSRNFYDTILSIPRFTNQCAITLQWSSHFSFLEIEIAVHSSNIIRIATR